MQLDVSFLIMVEEKGWVGGWVGGWEVVSTSSLMSSTSSSGLTTIKPVPARAFSNPVATILMPIAASILGEEGGWVGGWLGGWVEEDEAV